MGMVTDLEAVIEVPANRKALVFLPKRVSDEEIKLLVDRKKPILNTTKVVPKFSCVHCIVIVSPAMADVGENISSAGTALLAVTLFQLDGPMSVSVPVPR
jgi:hypothetical protein